MIEFTKRKNARCSKRNEMKFDWLSNFVANIVNASAIITDTVIRPLNDLHKQLTPQSIYCRIRSTSAEALDHILIACAVYFIVCLGLYKLTFWLSTSQPGQNAKNNNNKSDGNNVVVPSSEKSGLRTALQNSLGLRSVRLPKAAITGRVLLVIAHPDDESMFFGPLMYSLTKRPECQVYVLCLSNGN